MAAMKDDKDSKGKAAYSAVEQPLSKGTKQVSASSFAFLFSEMVQYCQSRSESTNELEKRLSEAGYGIGSRVLELLAFRESKSSRKEKSVVSMLQFIHSTVWKSMFGRQADDLKKSNDKEDEYYLYDKDPITNKFITVPRDMGALNCAQFVAGIVQGILDSAQFAAEVNAHFHQNVTVYVIKCSAEVRAR